MPDLLLITPPFTQLNTPYPATTYLKGFLNTKGISSFQMDLGIEVILRLFTPEGLGEIFTLAATNGTITSDNAKRIYALREEYLATINGTVSFLQGKQPTLARAIASENFLPQAGRFDEEKDLDWAFGFMGSQDKAKHVATLYLEDISDFIVECVDAHFGFSRYAERLGRSANNFDELQEELEKELTLVDRYTLEILEERVGQVQPKLVCLSVPFPGNLFSALRCAAHLRTRHPNIQVAMGGGFANTELRSVSDPRVFNYFHYICLDDGELPLELLTSNVLNPSPQNPDYNFLKRTFQLEGGKVVYNNFSLRRDYAQADVGTPDYSDLPLDRYISVIEVTNPMHSLWSDGRWNKLTMAHGCYWGKCTFCDVSLDYIKNYEPVAAARLVDRMETLIEQTGENGFHFVDEAAPPSLMRELALEILRRKLRVTWWTNIRFEKTFTADLCRLLQLSGCIAVSGGLEVASDRLLALIQKGVTVEQVAQVTGAFTDAGIMVHAYLMYGYPTQTVQETVDSLEMVRQLFEQGTVQSGFWHQFALTAHSPVGLDPETYGVVPDLKPISFANNDVAFQDRTGVDHERFSFGLKKSLFNYMHGACFDYPLQEWFDFFIPETSISPDFIAAAVHAGAKPIKSSAKLAWLGTEPDYYYSSEIFSLLITLRDRRDTSEITLDEKKGKWLLEKLAEASLSHSERPTYGDWEKNYEQLFGDFTEFWESEELELVRAYGLLVL